MTPEQEKMQTLAILAGYGPLKICGCGAAENDCGSVIQCDHFARHTKQQDAGYRPHCVCHFKKCYYINTEWQKWNSRVNCDGTLIREDSK